MANDVSMHAHHIAIRSIHLSLQTFVLGTLTILSPSYFEYFFFNLYVCLSVSVRICVQVSMEGKGIGVLGTGVIGGCEPPKVGAGY